MKRVEIVSVQSGELALALLANERTGEPSVDYQVESGHFMHNGLVVHGVFYEDRSTEERIAG